MKLLVVTDHFRDFESAVQLCSFNACKYNKQCKDLFDRIVAIGKSKKLALIAVCNKLLKQAFGIMKSGLCYDPNFKSVLARN
jgi:putative ribosome biogenesis GTPase RsgA